MSSLSWEPAEESIISLDSLWIYVENDAAKTLSMYTFSFAYNFFSLLYFSELFLHSLLCDNLL